MIITDNSQVLSIDKLLKEQGIRLISNEEYDEYIRLKKNAEYLAKIDESLAQLREGRGHEHELIEVEDDK